jgi:cytochrome P450
MPEIFGGPQAHSSHDNVRSMLLEFNPFSHEHHANPYPTYRRLRDEAPAYYNPKLDFWALSRFADVLNAYADWKTYTSTGGIAIESINSSGSMIDFDPPQQLPLRRLLNSAFTPASVRQLEPRVRGLCTEFLNEIVEEGGCDLVRDFAAKLPSDVISTLLGAPREDHLQIRLWTEATLTREPTGEQAANSAASLQNLREYFGALLAERRDQPRDDLASALGAVELEGRKLTQEEGVAFLMLLILGGNETTEKWIANSCFLLSEHPEQKQMILDDPGLIPDAAEESIRYISPTSYMARTTTRPVSLHGETIPEGKKVALLCGAANRDERQFPDPDRFDILRRAERHLAFGHGPHFCLGARLARLEVRVALQEIHRRIPDYQADPDGVDYMHGGNVAGFSRVPIHYSPSGRE